MNRSIAFLALLALPAMAQQGFTFEVESPPFRVNIPDLPAMKMRTHPEAPTRPHVRFMGSEGDYAISVITPTADPGMSPRDCANSTMRSLPERPFVQKDLIYGVRINADTYLAMYPAKMPGFVQLHAHFFSAAGGTHCVEVHASKVVTSEEDIRRWFKELFRTARIEPK